MLTKNPLMVYNLYVYRTIQQHLQEIQHHMQDLGPCTQVRLPMNNALRRAVNARRAKLGLHLPEALNAALQLWAADELAEIQKINAEKASAA